MLQGNNITQRMLCPEPLTQSRLAQIQQATKDDEICQQIQRYVRDGWPDRCALTYSLRPYWPMRGEITEESGILLYGVRILVPSSLRLDILDRIHEGHLGVSKCRERAKQSVWWPSISRQIKNVVENCRTCAYLRKQHRESLIPTELPERPFQVIGVDLFELNKRIYLLTVDYLSRFPIVQLLTFTTSTAVIENLKSCFAQHSIPEVLRSDNGPQFNSSEFKEFTKQWCIDHRTSSPKYPQSNGEVERSVQTIKNLLKKAEDPYSALLAYRTTPLANVSSPCELLMGRMLRTRIPVHPATLVPKFKLPAKLLNTEDTLREKQTAIYDNRHRASDLDPLNKGQHVFIPDLETEGTVVGKGDKPRAYNIETPKGLRTRNRTALLSYSRGA